MNPTISLNSSVSYTMTWRKFFYPQRRSIGPRPHRDTYPDIFVFFPVSKFFPSIHSRIRLGFLIFHSGERIKKCPDSPRDARGWKPYLERKIAYSILLRGHHLLDGKHLLALLHTGFSESLSIVREDQTNQGRRTNLW